MIETPATGPIAVPSADNLLFESRRPRRGNRRRRSKRSPRVRRTEERAARGFRSPGPSRAIGTCCAGERRQRRRRRSFARASRTFETFGRPPRPNRKDRARVVSRHSIAQESRIVAPADVLPRPKRPRWRPCQRSLPSSPPARRDHHADRIARPDSRARVWPSVGRSPSGAARVADDSLVARIFPRPDARAPRRRRDRRRQRLDNGKSCAAADRGRSIVRRLRHARQLGTATPRAPARSPRELPRPTSSSCSRATRTKSGRATPARR